MGRTNIGQPLVVETYILKLEGGDPDAAPAPRVGASEGGDGRPAIVSRFRLRRDRRALHGLHAQRIFVRYIHAFIDIYTRA